MNIDQVLGPARRALVADQPRAADDEDGLVAVEGLHPIRPCFGERDAVDARQDVDAVRGNSDLEGDGGARQVVDAQLLKRRTESPQRLQDAPGILAPAAFNAANRSLKSLLTGTSPPPFRRLDRQIPHEREPLPWRNPAPELSIEGTVVLVQIDEPRSPAASLLAPVHCSSLYSGRKTRLILAELSSSDTMSLAAGARLGPYSLASGVKRTRSRR